MSENRQRSDADAVLNSVRRLVTQNAPFSDQIAREDDAAASESTEVVHGPKSAEKLLLTPALRVIEDVPGPEPAPAVRPRSALEQRIAELELAVSSTDMVWEPDGSELIDTETPTRFAFRRDDSRPNETEDPSFDDLPDTPEAGAARDAAEEPEESAPPARDGVVQIPISEPRSVDAAQPDAAPVQGPREQIELGDEAVIDEEILRDLVAEIVRRELKGELGERITRNVRKLVRREIHRAMLTRGTE